MTDDVRILSVSPSLPLVPGMMTLPGLLVFTLVDSKPRASCVESSPLPDARGEGRSDGRVRTVLLLVMGFRVGSRLSLALIETHVHRPCRDLLKTRGNVRVSVS